MGHAEVKMEADGPCLVEVGARCHGWSGTWLSLVKECVGPHNQVQATIDAFLDEKAFHELPFAPPCLLKHGTCTMLVSREEGILKSVAADLLEKLPSFHKANLGHCHIGCHFPKTVDLFTSPGQVLLASSSADDLEADYKRIHDISEHGLFTIAKREAFVVVDPMSTGAFLAPMAIARGLSVICVYSSEELGDFKTHVPAEASNVVFDETITHSGSLAPEAIAETSAKLRHMGYNIVACVAGAECGVEVGEALADSLGLRGNGTTLSAARRNKYLMGERVRECGLRAVKQMKGSAASWSEIEAFLDKEAPIPFKMVVKPLDSCGSDGVYKCHSKEDVREACDAIVGHCNATGSFNSEVLVQEFLSGVEYVVDSVSRDGQHRIVAVWEYDKRAVNGAPFVYFGMRLMDPQDQIAQQLMNYMAGKGGVLDALGFQNGPGHAEVKMEADGPCLVEVGARCHGWSGTWLSLVNECVGPHNQVQVTMDVYLDNATFDALPCAPSSLLKHGTCVMLVSREEGTLSAVDTKLLETLPSFHKATLGHCHVGAHFPKTVDLFTSPGQVLLVSSSSEQLEADYAHIHEVSETKLFSIV